MDKYREFQLGMYLVLRILHRMIHDGPTHEEMFGEEHHGNYLLIGVRADDWTALLKAMEALKNV